MILKQEQLILDFIETEEFFDSKTLQQLINVKKNRAGTIKDVILKLGLQSEKDLTVFLKKYYSSISFKLPELNLIEKQVLSILPERFILDNAVIPFSFKNENSIYLGMVDTTDIWLIRIIENYISNEISPIPILQEEFNTYKEELEYISINNQNTEHDKKADQDALNEDDINRLRDMASLAPVIHLIEEIITQALEQNASDIHFIASARELRLKFRIDGLLIEQNPILKSMEKAVISRLKILSNLDISETRIPQDGSISTKVAGKDLDLRIATMPIIHGEGAILRLLRKDLAYASLEEIGFSKSVFHSVKTVINNSEGLFLVTGPTGSGKTTTLYAALKELIRPELNICSIEDPVENVLDNITQIEVNNATGLTFPKALKSLLRQDPDIIMLGEIRDSETAEIASRAALTGHLVLSTLHANNALLAIDRLIELGIDLGVLSSIFKGVMAQRLVPKLCNSCKQPAVMSEEKIDFINTFFNTNIKNSKKHDFYEKVGCKHCSHTGYNGRVLLSEILVLNHKNIKIIYDRANQESNLKISSESFAYEPMIEQGVVLLQQGLISIDDLTKFVPPAEAINI